MSEEVKGLWGGNPMGLGQSTKDLRRLPGRNHLTAGSLRIRPKTGFPSGLWCHKGTLHQPWEEKDCVLHFGLNCALPKIYMLKSNCLLKFICWSSKPWDLRMWLYLKIGFLKKGLIKMRSLGWILVQCDWSPHKMGEFRHRDAHRRKMM